MGAPRRCGIRRPARSIARWSSIGSEYDLRMVLEQNWKTLGPKLRGKITIWVGEADEYFLNNAVHMLDAFLSKADPPYEGRIIYGPGKGHGWMALDEREMMNQMAAAIEKAPEIDHGITFVVASAFRCYSDKLSD